MIDFYNNVAVFGKKDIIITPTMEETSQGLAATVILEDVNQYMKMTEDYTLETLRPKNEDSTSGGGNKKRAFEPDRSIRLSFTTEESINTFIQQLISARELRFGANNKVEEFYKFNDSDEEVKE